MHPRAVRGAVGRLQRQAGNHAMVRLLGEQQGQASSAGALEAPRVSPALESYLSASNGAGAPMPRSVRERFEPRFGHDFGEVRLHTGERAARAAGEINAQAFAVGPNIHFAQGRFQPGTAAGNRLLAHELTHVLQQAGGQRVTLQRQPSPEESPVGPLPDLPESDVDCSIDFAAGKWRDFINCCGKSPVGRGCTKDAIAGVCKIIDCDEKPTPIVCPPGFKPAGAEALKGQCCPTKAKSENARECCEPARITKKAQFPKCCPSGTTPNGSFTACVTIEPPPSPTPCLPGQATPGGECCKLPAVPRGNSCVVPPPKPPSPPPKPSPPTSVIILFQKDKPAAGSKKSLDDSLSTGGRARFDELVTLLRERPTVKVELVGRASPEGADEYNLALAQRRAEQVAAALAGAGIDASRIATHPDGLRAECQPIRPGILTCGEAGAIGPEDRQVLARPFLPGQ